MKRKSCISRRNFVKAGVAGVLAPMMTEQPGGKSALIPGPPAKKGLKFSVMVTMSDWAMAVGAWGEPGVYYLIKKIKEAGFSRVYWRTTDGSAQAPYPSRVTDPAVRIFWDPKRFPVQQAPWFKKAAFLQAMERKATGWLQHPIDYSDFDSVKAGRDRARTLGLEFYAWHEHSEDYGAGFVSQKILEHPEWFTKNRDGKRSQTRVSWGIEPAVDYRLAWVLEVMQYQPDGIFFDFVKSMGGDPNVGFTPHFDLDGVWYCTYDEPVVNAFKEKTGRDPFKIPNSEDEWVRFRAGYVTSFLTKVRQLQRELYPQMKIGVFGCPKGRGGFALNEKVIPLADPLRAYLEDHETWSREGLLDEFVNACIVSSGAKPEEYEAMIRDSRSRVHAPCKYKGSQLGVYGAKEKNDIPQGARIASELGCEEVVFFESTPLETNRTWDVTKEVIEKYGA